MLDRLFETPAVSGLESDAFWMGLFLGILTSFGLTSVLVFVLLPPADASNLLPFVIPLAVVLAYPFARGWIRLLYRLVDRYRVGQGQPRVPEE